jgi:hypothetical protein
MTAYKAARKWGVHPTTVTEWISKGKIPATKIRNAQGRMVWDIPDDTHYPPPVTGCSRCSTAGEAREKRVLRDAGKRGYIAKFVGAFSIKHMAEFLGTTCAEVRAIYDDIVAKGGF